MPQFFAQMDNGDTLEFSKNEMIVLLSLLINGIAINKEITEDTLLTIQIKKNEHRADY